jgi:hypothetical protein
VRQLLTESVILSATGAALGLALAHWSSRVLVHQLSTWAYTAVLDLSIDSRVLGVTVATTVATAMLFGAAPALRASRVHPNDALKQTRASAERDRPGIAEGLVVIQVARWLGATSMRAMFPVRRT